MTNQNRAQRKADKNSAASQAGKGPEMQSAKPQTAPAAIPELVNPSKAAIHCIDALDAFRFRVNEAGAMCLVVAANIQWHAKSFEGWEIFDDPGFIDGVFGCARAALTHLTQVTNTFTALHQPLADRLRNLADPVALPQLAPGNYHAIVVKLNPAFAEWDSLLLDDSSSAMEETLELLGVTLYERGGRDKVGFYAPQLAKANLARAQSDCHKAAHALRMAAAAVEWQRAGEHRAAA